MKSFEPFEKINGNFEGRDFVAPKNFLLLKQVHGDKIYLVRSEEEVAKTHLQEGDAIICTQKNIPIAVKTADCVPILLAHPEGMVAAVHAGWRGTRLKILEKVLLKIREDLKMDLSSLRLSVGPSICASCYEVGEEVAKEFEGFERGVVISTGKYFLDLKFANLLLAKNCGVPAGNITVYPDCTLCDPKAYYSYRYESQTGLSKEGRNYSWVRLI